MWSSGVTSLETLATFPVYVNTSNPEVTLLSGWLGTSRFNKPIKHSLQKEADKFFLVLISNRLRDANVYI